MEEFGIGNRGWMEIGGGTAIEKWGSGFRCEQESEARERRGRGIGEAATGVGKREAESSESVVWSRM
ncbi:hypothetical protein KFK09_022798 [Dendrobium nobile]|uniref:Uncharacterized protein n=1 Tax=Dendrobium nobile TaxID=94219 RepID=A0A8T3AKI6_DENNO|nr:hypothetical protein KFK09_022798 [Dendrobium nobile]